MSEEDSPKKHPGKDSQDRQSPLVPVGGRIVAVSRKSLVRRGLDQLGLMTKSRIRLILVDDFAETRRNLRKLLRVDDTEARIEIIGEAETGTEGIALYRRHNPDIVLTNVHMPTMDGITMAQNITAESPAAKILFLSVDSAAPIIRMALQCGAYGYLLKPPNPDTLVRLIVEIARQSGHGRRFYFDEYMSLYELEGDFVDHEVIRPKRGWSHHPAGALIEVASPRPTGTRLVKDLSFTELTRLDLSSSAITDAAGPVVGRALNLKSLSAAHTRVGDDFLSRLAACKRLQFLDLTGTGVGFSSNSVFSSLSGLSHLHLAQTNVGDEFMFSLSASRQLESLDISSTAVGITGLSVLPNMINLTTLVMNHMERNMGDLQDLARIPGLRSLNVKTARIEKGALRNLAQLHRLEYLGLEGTPLEEGDVHAIASIHALKSVDLRNTGLDADAIELLKRRLPACEIRM